MCVGGGGEVEVERFPPRSFFVVSFARRLPLERKAKQLTSWNAPVASTPTSEVLPAFWRPTRESSISLLKNRLFFHKNVEGEERERFMGIFDG